MPTTGCLSTSASLTSSFFPFSIDSSSYLKPKPTMCDIGCAGHNPPTAIKHFFFSLLQYSGNCAQIFPASEQCLSPPLRHSGHKSDLKWIKLPSWSGWSSCSDSREGGEELFAPRLPSLSRSTSATSSPPISPRIVISLRPCCHLLQQVFFPPCRHEEKWAAHV